MGFKKIIFQNRYVALETPSRPFMANAILNFHFDYLTPSLKRFWRNGNIAANFILTKLLGLILKIGDNVNQLFFAVSCSRGSKQLLSCKPQKIQLIWVFYQFGNFCFPFFIVQTYRLYLSKNEHVYQSINSTISFRYKISVGTGFDWERKSAS